MFHPYLKLGFPSKTSGHRFGSLAMLLTNQRDQHQATHCPWSHKLAWPPAVFSTREKKLFENDAMQKCRMCVIPSCWMQEVDVLMKMKYNFQAKLVGYSSWTTSKVPHSDLLWYHCIPRYLSRVGSPSFLGSLWWRSQSHSMWPISDSMQHFWVLLPHPCLETSKLTLS